MRLAACGLSLRRPMVNLQQQFIGYFYPPLIDFVRLIIKIEGGSLIRMKPPELFI
jgi:hypothetical protein